MGSKITPSLISEGGPLRPPMGATESDTPWEVGLRMRGRGFLQFKRILIKPFSWNHQHFTTLLTENMHFPKSIKASQHMIMRYRLNWNSATIACDYYRNLSELLLCRSGVASAQNWVASVSVSNLTCRPRFNRTDTATTIDCTAQIRCYVQRR